jgi:hypothetical protein
LLVSFQRCDRWKIKNNNKQYALWYVWKHYLFVLFLSRWESNCQLEIFVLNPLGILKKKFRWLDCSIVRATVTFCSFSLLGLHLICKSPFFCNLLKKKISYVPSLYSHKWPSNWPELIAGYKLYFKLAKTHMLGHVQYRELWVSLGLMGSLPNNCLGVLSGMTT